MLQNARAAAFTVSELLTENQQEGRGVVKLPPPPPPRLALSTITSILMHEYQRNSTGINMNLARINMSPTRVNTNQHESNAIQQESDTSQHE